LIDIEAGETRALRWPAARGRNIVRAVVRGPFLRVVAPGDCLRVRAEPGAAGRELVCAADGVLLTDLGETRETADGRWRKVRAPDGVEGWASDPFLER